VLIAATWRAAQTTYFSPGTHTVVRQDSNAGAVLGFLVMVAAAIGCLAGFAVLAGGKSAAARRVLGITGGGFVAYVAAAIAVSLATPRTIVTPGDSYCYDLWCIGVQQVTAVPAGGNAVYTIAVRLSSDANRVKTSAGGAVPYLMDGRGRRFSPAQDPAATPLTATLRPGESFTTTVRFVVPAGARRLYLTRDNPVMPWVPLYFGSDLAPFHRRTLLRVV
jgi:hypothetical protein